MTTPLHREEGNLMEIHVTTDHNVDGRDGLIRHATSEVTAGLSRASDHLTRVDVHLADESSGRHTSADQRCTLEAFPAGQSPVAVTHHADTLEAALTGAIHKLQRLLESKFARLDNRDARDTIRGNVSP
jgi:ribosome-associated translation inhibitor RaiA